MPSGRRLSAGCHCASAALLPAPVALLSAESAGPQQHAQHVPGLPAAEQWPQPVSQMLAAAAAPAEQHELAEPCKLEKGVAMQTGWPLLRASCPDAAVLALIHLHQ